MMSNLRRVALVLGVMTGAHVAAIPSPMRTNVKRDYPDVIPGPGLPSLASLGLTSAQLYEMPLNLSRLETQPSPVPLAKRTEPGCGLDNGYTDINGIIACFNYLNFLNQACVTPPNKELVYFCQSGTSVVLGQGDQQKQESSWCSDVAMGGVLWVMNNCDRDDGRVAGWNAAWGNGGLIVISRQDPRIPGCQWGGLC